MSSYTVEDVEGVTPRVFIASPMEPTAGEWVDATEAEHQAGEIRERYDHEEVIVVDSEHMPHTESVVLAQELADMIEKHGHAFTGYYEMTGDTDHFEDSYFTSGVSDFEELAREYADITGMVDDENARYFDYEALGRDLKCSGWWIDDNGNAFMPV
jgi:antirestriction protein